MAVYTPVSDAELEAFLDQYDIGAPIALKGIAEGVENTNFYLETTAGRFILTLFERRVAVSELPYFIQLKQHLAARGFSCPRPIAARDGTALRSLSGRPAVIVTFLDGLSPRAPTAAQCDALGAGLAQLHSAAADFSLQRPNTLGLAAWQRLFAGRAEAADALQPGLGALIARDLVAVAERWPRLTSLPRGTIHADLFPDNAFFLGDAFSGVIDFYFACTDLLAYDLAISLNAWAFDDQQDAAVYNADKGGRLIAAYETVRPLSPAERAALPVLAHGAALRFFMTRLADWTATPAGALVRPKNPLEYAHRLVFHRGAATPEDYGA
jgi:homoserine kinase type II